MVLNEKFASDPIFFENEIKKNKLATTISKANDQFYVLDTIINLPLDDQTSAQFLNIAIPSSNEKVVFLTGTKVVSDGEKNSHTLVNLLEICL